MPAFSSELAEGKLLAKFHTPLKRKQPDGEGAEDDGAEHSPHPAPSPAPAPRPSAPVMLPQSHEPSYLCQWREPQARKHKTWQGDAVLVVHGNGATASLRSVQTGKLLVTSARMRSSTVAEGDEMYIGGKEVLIERALDGTENEAPAAEPPRPAKPPHPRGSLLSSLRRPIPASSFYASPTQSSEAGDLASPARPPQAPARRSTQEPHPRYDPSAPGAVVMKRPSEKHQQLYGSGLPVVDVVLDPDLTRVLRPHQIEGVSFLYEAVTGMTSLELGHTSPGQGAILADEMGLGKTLQTITLVLTLLRQSCYFSSVTTGTIGKVLIACPLTLVANWKREFRKWIGRSSIGVLAVEGDGRSEVERFVSGRQYQVLIIGYDRLRNCAKELARAHASIGLIVCDEGHRLKSKDAKTTRCFDLFPTKRRVLLTGTPIQNDLGELYAMVDFVYPGLFDKYSVFKRVFEDPIVRSRMHNCPKHALELGAARQQALMTITKGIILRRTAEILVQYLPPKYELTLFCSMTPVQRHLYRVLALYVQRHLLFGDGRGVLAYITLLRQLCNSPELLRSEANLANRSAEPEMQALGSTIDALLERGLAHVPRPSSVPRIAAESGKLAVLHELLHSIRAHTSDRVVIASSYTQTLDLLQRYCSSQRFPFVRLDGRTKQDERMQLVHEFNSVDSVSDATEGSSAFVFLLSTKSGGLGLNLTGANRLVLFDSDWNPSTDQQAMARIHRDGQRKPCYVYRMLLVGSMDEKIYQRQVCKIGLSDSLMGNEVGQGDDAGSRDSFTQEDLKDIFALSTNTTCLTHDLLSCGCGGTGTPMARSAVSEPEVDPAPRAGFVAASAIREQTTALKQRSQKLAAQLSDVRHYDFAHHANYFHDDPILRHAAERQHGLREQRYPSVVDKAVELAESKLSNELVTILAEELPAHQLDMVRQLLGRTPDWGEQAPGGDLLYVFSKPPSSAAVQPE